MREEIYRFIVEEIDSVPQLEALLLFWKKRPQSWSSAALAKALYVSPDVAHEILKYLAEHHLIAEVAERTDCYVLQIQSGETEKRLELLDTVYRQELVRVSNMIHSKAPRSMRDFADAFRFRKG
jgi:hypothetical protein